MNTLINALERNNDLTRTLNGAPTFKTSGSKLLDLFGQGAAMRLRSESDTVELFKKAWNEDKLIALKTLFWIRDIRGGAGEREVFRRVLRWLANNAPDVVVKNLENIPYYGRWDDLLVLMDTPCEKEIIEYIQRQLILDLECLNKE